jgi:tetratricopeptide (TPR) repeat protein
MQNRRTFVVVALLLSLITVVVYWQVQNHDFVNYDDHLYVTENWRVQAGLNWDNIVSAFSQIHDANWHPLVLLSHMLDCDVFGLRAGGHHLTNVIFHLTNTLLLFLVLNKATGAIWRSAFVAALFAVHPSHVESVAWVSERKDVLSTLFWVLSMWTYVRYTRLPTVNRYLLTLLCFSAGLMAKPMLVTLPFVLLLLDYWPLRRFELPWLQRGGYEKGIGIGLFGRGKIGILPLLVEKLPLLVLSAGACAITFVAQKAGGAMGSLDEYSLGTRLGNSVLAYVSYVGKTFWPKGLAVFYPYPAAVSLWKALGAGFLLLFISAAVIRVARRCPYLVVGWLWYIGTLIPVIGLVQVGAQSMADRYTYIPAIGLFVMVAWGIWDIVGDQKYAKVAVGAVSALVVLVLAYGTTLQVSHWKDSVALFQRALAVTENNPVAHNNYGLALEERGNLDEAVFHYRAALQIKPDFSEVHNNLASALEEKEDSVGARFHYSQAIRMWPDFAEAHNNFAGILKTAGELDEATSHYFEALRINPNFAEAHNNLAVLLAEQGDLDKAVVHYFEALRIRPVFAEAHNNVGNVFAMQNDLPQAIAHYQEAVRLKSDYAEAHKNLGLAYWLVGRRDLALDQHKIVERLDVPLSEELAHYFRQLGMERD